MQKIKMSLKKPVDEKAQQIDHIKTHIEYIDREIVSKEVDTPYLFEMAKIKNCFNEYLKGGIQGLFNLYGFLLAQKQKYNNQPSNSPDEFNLELEVLLNEVRFLVSKFHPLGFCKYIGSCCEKNTITLFLEDSNLTAEATIAATGEKPQDKLSTAVETLATAFSNVKLTATSFWSNTKSNPPTPRIRSTIIMNDNNQNPDNIQQHSNIQQLDNEYRVDVLNDRKLWFDVLGRYLIEEQEKLTSEREAWSGKGYDTYFDDQDNLLQWQQYYLYYMRENIAKQEQYLNDNNIEALEAEEKMYLGEYFAEFNKYKQQYEANQTSTQQNDTEANRQVSDHTEQMTRRSISISLKSASLKLNKEQTEEIKRNTQNKPY